MTKTIPNYDESIMTILADGTDLSINSQARKVNDLATALEWNPIVEAFDTSKMDNPILREPTFLAYSEEHDYYFVAIGVPEADYPWADEQIPYAFEDYLKANNIVWG